uniref:Uncharacterized protein n=1 Tax=Knipowitschia caucasica TaxID=637954 RepID=A0AAV2LAT6_KNICA
MLRLGLYGQHETQQLLRPSLLRPEELSMESGIDPGQDYYTQDYYNYDHGFEYGSRRKLISPSGPYDEYGEVIVDEDGSYYYSPQESDTEVKRQVQGGTVTSDSKRSQSRSSGKPTQTKNGTKSPSEIPTKPKSAMEKLKSVLKLGSLFSLSANKGSGQPPAVHPPWSKARVGPERKGKSGPEKPTRDSENPAGAQTREAATEPGPGRANRRMPNNGMRNGFGGGLGPTSEQRRIELPGLPSSSWSGSVGNGILIDGTYFQTASEANKAAPAKQQLSEALSLISLSRRLQGAAVAPDWDNPPGPGSAVRVGTDGKSGGSLEERGKLEEQRKASKESEFSDTSSSSTTDAGNFKNSENDSVSKTETEESDTEKDLSDSDEGESSDRGSESSRRKRAKSRPQTSRRRSLSTDESEEESDGSEAEEAESPRNHDDLSPIMEDSEEERSSGQDED